MTLTPDRLLETFFAVDDLDACRDFYRDVLGLESYGSRSDRGALFRLPGGQLLGLVNRPDARRPNTTPSGVIPAVIPEDRESRGPSSHLAFAVPDVEPWRARLAEHGVEVLEEVAWERGGRSLYFRDPDGNLLEVASPGLWEWY